MQKSNFFIKTQTQMAMQQYHDHLFEQQLTDLE